MFGLLSVFKIGSFVDSLVSHSKGSIECVSLNNYRCQANTC